MPARLQVFLPALALLLLSATGLCLFVIPKTFRISPELLSLWVSILAGPYAAPWSLPEQSGGEILATVKLVLLFTHPLWPNRVMAVSFSGV